MQLSPPICVVLGSGFWLEIADDHSFAELFDLTGVAIPEGRPTPYPVKRIVGVTPTDEDGPTYNATYFAARAWGQWAREQQAAGLNPFDGDGYRPLGAPPDVDSLALMFDPSQWTDAPAGLSGPLNEDSPKRPRRTRKD
jgi:hypothetical protein